MADDETKLPQPTKLPSKVYFRIGEVASLVGVEPHVLRYWEREFRTIRPKKSARGQRVYSRKDVETLMRVRQLLYSEGFTIAGARRRLQQERSGHALDVPMPADESADDLTTAAMADAELASSASPARETAAEERGARAVSPLASAAKAAPSVPVFESAGPLFERTILRDARSDGDGAAAPHAEPTTKRAAPPPRVERSALDGAAQTGTVEAAAMRAALRELRGEIEAFLGDLGSHAH